VALRRELADYWHVPETLRQHRIRGEASPTPRVCLFPIVRIRPVVPVTPLAFADPAAVRFQSYDICTS
jgi:hypothetical protein